MMDDAPYDFVIHHSESELKKLEEFKHRTFNSTDTLYFISFLKWYYERNASLETLFMVDKSDANIKSGIINFHTTFCSLPYFPARTGKHVSTPTKNSACKRINMFLRWMVRVDNRGVDFGIWKRIPSSQLVCPCDIHVENVARKLGLVTGKKANWKMAEELTATLKQFDSSDPVKYDFALFGLGVEEKFWH